MFTLIQSKTNFTAGGTTVNVVMDSATTAGSGIIVGIVSDTAVTSVTDSQGNTYTLIDQMTTNSSIWACYGVPAAALTVTVSSGPSGFRVWVREFSDIAALDVSHDDNYSSNTPSLSTLVTSSQADSLVLGAVTSGFSTAGVTLGAGFSNLTVGGSVFGGALAIENKVVTSAGIQTVTFTIAPPFGTSTGRIGVYVFRAAIPTRGVRFRKPVSGGVKVRGNVRIRA